MKITNIDFINVNDEMPRPNLECLIYAFFEEVDEEDVPALFYGFYDGEKWMGVMPWEILSNDGDLCVLIHEIHANVVAWARFPEAEEVKNK